MLRRLKNFPSSRVIPQVSFVTELPGGGLRLNLEGLATPLRLGVVQEELLLRVKVG